MALLNDLDIIVDF